MESPPQIKPHHLERLAFVGLRQSSRKQVLSNVGSTDVQRGLRKRARALGWPESRIRIIEELGVSGSKGVRHEFQHLLDLMDRDEVGIVLFNDASRLSRRPLEAETLWRRQSRTTRIAETAGSFAAATGPSWSFRASIQIFSHGDPGGRTRITPR